MIPVISYNNKAGAQTAAKRYRKAYKRVMVKKDSLPCHDECWTVWVSGEIR